MTGWECPKCGKCYSPMVTTCVSCGQPPVSVGMVVISPTLRCTCGDGTSAGCPVHRQPWSYTFFTTSQPPPLS